MTRATTTGTTSKRKVGRRSLIAGAAAAAGGAVAAKLSSATTAQAADGQAILQGTAGNAQNVASSTTTLKSGLDFLSSVVFTVDGTQGLVPSLDAISGLAHGSGKGVTGRGDVGIAGIANTPNGVGVSATGQGTGRGVSADALGSGAAVHGTSAGGPGVVGQGSTTGVVGRVTGTAAFDHLTGAGTGVYGRADGTSPPQAAVLGYSSGTNAGMGVFGVSNATWTNNNLVASGVYGVNNSDGPGVSGVSINGIGVYGFNVSSGDGDPAACGGFFTTTGNNTNAMVSQVFNNVTNAAAFVGSAAPGGGRLAGYFNGDTQFTGSESHTGNVTVNGNHTVTGTKSAAVPMADGRLHKVYAVEAPESWFEDYGEAAMTGNSTFVPFPADFAQVVDTAKYHVFLTPTGAPVTLSVESRTPAGFTVSAAGRGANGFSYRIVAKRKDVEAPRFDGFAPPAKANIRIPFDAPPPVPAETMPGRRAYAGGAPGAGSPPTPEPRGR